MIILHHLFVLGKAHPLANKIGSYFYLAVSVEIFFVIAGYFLAVRLINNSSWGSYDLVLYIKKRMNRLIPVVFVWCLIPLVLSCMHIHSVWLSPEIMWRKFISGITMLRNFEEMSGNTGFGYFWAVSLEFQFFLVFLMLFYLLKAKIMFYLSLALLVPLPIYRNEIFLEGNPWMFRIDGLLWGYVLAYVQLKIPDAFQSISDIIKSFGRWKAISFFFFLLLVYISINWNL